MLLLVALLGCVSGDGSDADTTDTASSITTYGTTDPCDAGDGEVWVMPGAALLGGDLDRTDALAVVDRGSIEDPSRLRIGRALASVGDLDGDGLSELAVVWASEVAILSGASLAAGTADLEAPLARFVGSYPMALQTVGDLDGDGWPELAVVQAEDEAYTGSTVVLSSSTLALGGTLGPADAFAELVDAASEGIHTLRPNVGDLDGDGADDLALLAALPGDASADSDEAVYRRLDVWLAADLAAGGMYTADQASAQLTESEELPLHHHQGRLGDLDGDGSDELLVGRHIFSGGSLIGSLGVADAWSAPGAGASEDVPLAWMDVDGDGVSELLLQDVGWAAGGTGGLEVELVSGASWTDGHGVGTVLAASGHDLQHVVVTAGSLPDLDGDGVDEAWAFVGRGYAQTPPELRVWSGAGLGSGWELAAPDGLVVLPDCEGQTQIVPLGDLDGDGLSELAVSLPANEAGG